MIENLKAVVAEEMQRLHTQRFHNARVIDLFKSLVNVIDQQQIRIETLEKQIGSAPSANNGSEST